MYLKKKKKNTLFFIPGAPYISKKKKKIVFQIDLTPFLTSTSGRGKSCLCLVSLEGSSLGERQSEGCGAGLPCICKWAIPEPLRPE